MSRGVRNETGKEQKGGATKQLSSMDNWSSILPENARTCLRDAPSKSLPFGGITFVDFQYAS